MNASAPGGRIAGVLMVALALGPRVISGADAPPAAWFEGRIGFAEALELRVPKNQLELAGQRLDSRTVRLESIVRDGSRVRAGAVLAEFAFPEKLLAEAVEQRVRLAEAERDCELAGLEERLRKLQARQQLAELEADKALLETKKKSVLSRREAELVELAERQARFEVQALGQQIEAQQQALQAVTAYHAERLRQAEQLRGDLEALRARFRLVATREGRVVLARLADRGRPARKGDRLRAAQPLLTLALDDRQVVRFAVPEARLGGLVEGGAVTVQALTGDEPAAARITAVQPDPQRRSAGGGRWLWVTAEMGATAGFGPGQTVRVGL